MRLFSFFFFCFPDVRYAGKKHAWAQNRSLCLHVTVKTTKNMDNNMKKGHQTDGKNSLDDVESNFEFESVSCFVFSKHSRLRQWTVQLLQWPYPFKSLANSCWSNTEDCVHFTFVVSFASHSPSSSSYQLNRKYHLSLSVKDWRYPVIERLYSAVYANCFFFFLSNMLKRAKIVPLYIIDQATKKFHLQNLNLKEWNIGF